MTFRPLNTLVIGSTVIVSILTMTAVANAEALNRQLDFGMSGPDVSTLQAFLAQDKTLYPQGLITGYFGFLTKAAVSNFQSRNGLPAVGRVGPMTLPVINQKMTGNVSASNVTTPLGTTIPVTTQLPSYVASENSAATGATELVVMPVPLLSGGVTNANASVPVAYLQVTNTGKDSLELRGFWVKQNGSASDQTIAGLSTIDDRDNLLGATKAMPFEKNIAFVPAPMYIVSGQTRLFTIRANLASNIQTEVGRQLMIDVTSIDSAAPIKGSFPIRGTTWTIN